MTLLDRSEGLQQVKGDLAADDWILRNVAAGPQPGERVKRQETALDMPGKPDGDGSSVLPADPGMKTNSGDK